ncbi:class I SAM-dependent methyltransferase [Kiritimatiellota bacterium B12222]|nr:class I SAM-dependent methyltransferase [Kiritimatiellota bacterium B12222]
MNSDTDLSSLKPGDDHYMAYVGPPTEYDLMGATQFRLLCALGLRSHHRLLDFGCGSLRAGKLFLSYLDKERYFGIEPHQWLIDEAIQYQLGQDMINLKSPRFDHNTDFQTDVFDTKFDFILAQSIFSHCGSDLILKALHHFKASLNPNGLIAVTFVEGESDFDGNGWVYPECVTYLPNSLQRFATEVGLVAKAIPWHHPRQTWYLLALDHQRLPPDAYLPFLTGSVLFDPKTSHPWNLPGLKPQMFMEDAEAPTENQHPPSFWRALRHRLFPHKS